MQRTLMTILSILLSVTAVSHAGQGASDPFLGDWQGEGVVAQVIPAATAITNSTSCLSLTLSANRWR